jgi:hypothetical protein
MRHFKKGAFQFTIPVIDVSQTMVYNDTNAFYNAVGIALSVACNSSIESRVIAVANSSIWIQFHHTDDFVDIVDNFFTSIAPIQGSPLLQNTSINLIIQGIKGSYSTTRFVDNLNILFVSDFSQNNVFHLHELYPNVKDLFIQNGFDVAPYVFYWNVSTHHTLDVSTIMDYTKNRVFSGSSIHLLHDFIYIIEKQTHAVFSPYEAAVFSVDKHRYLPLSTYLYSWFSTYPM